MVYVPALSPVAFVFVPPLGVHAYVYAGVPPAAVTVAEPLLPPLHNTFVCALIVAVNKGGWVIVTEVVAVQPFLSVTVTV